MLLKDFLSLSEVASLFQENGLNCLEKDILYLASKEEFKAYNSIYPLPRIGNSNPLYKIQGLKGIFELQTQTKVKELLIEKCEESASKEITITMKEEQDSKHHVIFKDDITGNKEVFICDYYHNPTEARFDGATISFPVYDGLGNQFDIIRGMVNSRMLYLPGGENYLNSTLFFNMLKKSLNNFYVVNSEFDHFYFTVGDIVKYTYCLIPYYLSKLELIKDKDLAEIYDEEDFNLIFFFKYDEIIRYIESHVAHKHVIYNGGILQTENASLKAQLEQQTQQIADLQSQLENLKKPDTQALEHGGNIANIPVNHDDFSIYGHSSENLKLLFEMTKKIAAKCDPENVYSYPKKEDFINYVRKYLTDNQKLAESLYQIIIPEKVKIRGNTPKGVNTFQGFI
ncbi:hypothetical protein [Actinobacillus equuli]|uniref:hypothetical protein n=1 Tax=Actinobacillus equuli TaxID=718 RepID=UPI002442FE82|nr:hypothetical protein [Actinobacillus equuli]WGE49193.1 hypothetical protein NYR67_02475 [Actinobacillus equuli subsp. equuli]